MRMLAGVSVILLMSASAAWAQEAPSNHTLNEQLMRVQQGQPVVAQQQTMAANNMGNMGDTVGGFTRRHTDDTQLGSGAIPSLPLEEQTVNNIKFITGGIGDEEEAQLKMVDQNYNTHVLFTSPSGDYISEVMVRILNAKQGDQPLLETENAGPYFFVNLPPGSYVFEATAKEGGIKKISFKVPSKGVVRQHITFLE